MAEKKKTNVFRRIGSWFKKSWSEFKKVSWPTFNEVVKATGVVLLVVVAFIIVLTVFDLGLTKLLELLVQA
ncbi:MAG: preprotein translocase subunit SecE [Clostridia bacterium]|nr:preprotein translocase subunit SecE [Clostridia bacterium]